MGDAVYAASCSGVLFAYDRASGDVRWTYDTARDGARAQFHGDPIVTDRLLVIPSDARPAGHVYAFELATGEVRWKTPVPPEGVASHLLRYGDLVLGQTPGGRIVALELATGVERWSFDPETGPELRAPNVHPALAGDRVVTPAPDGKVRALAAGSGELLWTADLGDRPNTAVTLDGEHLLVGTADGVIHRLALADGAQAASLKLPATPVGTPTLTADSLVLVMSDGLLAAVDRGLGGLRWTFSDPQGWSSFQPRAEGDRILAGTNDGTLYAFALDDGEIVWQDRLGGTLRGIGESGGVYYIGTLQGTLYAYSAAAGAGRGPDPVAWLAGTWRGAQGGGTIEEAWSERDGDNRMGMFRLVSGGSVVFYEFMSIEYEEAGLVLRIKHFDKGLRGWEEPEVSEVFRLAESGPRRAVFAQDDPEEPKRLIYELADDGELTVVLEKDRPEGTSRSEFKMRRR